MLRKVKAQPNRAAAKMLETVLGDCARQAAMAVVARKLRRRVCLVQTQIRTLLEEVRSHDVMLRKAFDKRAGPFTKFEDEDIAAKLAQWRRRERTEAPG